VTAGSGRVQSESGPIEEMSPGDVVLISPGEKHWHGASPTAAMTHIAINEAPTSWTEKVSDEQYG
jgi:quercetin dioxygenase-like cupin family protein